MDAGCHYEFRSNLFTFMSLFSQSALTQLTEEQLFSFMYYDTPAILSKSFIDVFRTQHKPDAYDNVILMAAPSRQLEETTRASSYHLVEHRPV